MKRMLSTLLTVLVIAGIAGCKKNGSGGSSPLTVLSQVFSDGKLQLQYDYNDKQQVSKITEYDLASGKPDYSQEFIYDKRGRLENILDYNNSGKQTGKQQFFKDLDGHFTRVDYSSLTGTDSGKVVTRIEYTYNKQGFIVKEAWVDLVTGKPTSYRANAWDANGNLKTSDYYGQLNPAVLWWTTEYTAGKPLPETLAQHSGYPINFSLYYFVAEEIHTSLIAGYGTPEDYTEFMTGRTYNNEGFLTDQTITLKHKVPISVDKVSVMKYVYKQI